MYYSIRHVTRFRYSNAISESVMEVRMQPRTEGPQRCLHFELNITPRAHVMSYRDDQGNTVHHFNIPGQHHRLVISAQALVEMSEPPPLPAALDGDAWERLDTLVNESDAWDWLMPSTFARPTAALKTLADELDVSRRADPLTLVRQINSGMFESFTYKPQSTDVDSPIDEALKSRAGVCQDYAHIMISLVRELGIPCRYVSGYLFHSGAADRSAADATHAWVEALLPELGWVGFDPTNNLLSGPRHIRAAVGRDYADVPPTRGVFKGRASTELSVAVAVKPTDVAPTDAELQPAYSSPGWTAAVDADTTAQQEQQQQ